MQTLEPNIDPAYWPSVVKNLLHRPSLLKNWAILLPIGIGFKSNNIGEPVCIGCVIKLLRPIKLLTRIL
jgi:hypothetical protein